ncbi:hypothetical protein G6F37_008587 [Rhizopus arrhizus]|nr:hypothetical protein G6F38_008265 [Rhizopus arrhizus]KAG1155384.1 hypothetical protein G6F37_008587 [Rhizopus arrhizus]
MLRQLNTLSKLTTSSIKYAANNTATFVGLPLLSREDTSLPLSQKTAYWISDTQKGLDAFFNDEFELAQNIFMQHHLESPFHAVGFALIAYVEAILGFEAEKIQIALERINAAEILAKQFIRKVRRKGWYKFKYDQYESEHDLASVAFDSSHYTAKKIRSPEIQYELLATNCMLMSSTIQFLRHSWLEYMKAAYKLRKAYKLYEQMFEALTGQKASEYAARLCKRTPVERQQFLYSTHNEKKLSSISVPSNSVKINFDNTIHMEMGRKKRKQAAAANTSYHLDESLDLMIIENATESVNKILNTLGFQSSRPFALHLLQKSFKTLGLYSSLSALSLLAYYTNLSLFIHPYLLPKSLSLENAREILDQMKTSFPNGKIWKLLEGKLYAEKNGVVCELAQLQALAVYEMGWGQIFLGDYFQASETFFRLESMNNWSRAFYHYIATCCIFADEEYGKAAMEFMHIPSILKRKRQLGGKLLPNEIFAERKIKHWKLKSINGNIDINLDNIVLDGFCLKKVVVINPLWELIYLWNGLSQLTPHMLHLMKYTIETSLETLTKEEIGTDLCQLYLLLGVSVRELGDHDLADMYLRQAMESEDAKNEDKWALPHVYYEMAALNCFKLLQTSKKRVHTKLLKDAEDWIQKCERILNNRHNSNIENNHINDPITSDNSGDSDWDSRLHVRCQLLIEKLDDFKS